MIFSSKEKYEEEEDNKVKDKLEEVEEKVEEEDEKKEIVEEKEKKSIEYVEDVLLKNMNPLEREVFKYVKSEGFVEEQKKYKSEDNYSGTIPSMNTAYFKKEEFDFKNKEDEERRKKQANL